MQQNWESIKVNKSRKSGQIIGDDGLNYWSICKSQNRTEPGVRKDECSKFASNTQYKCFMKTSRKSVTINVYYQCQWKNVWKVCVLP